MMKWMTHCRLAVGVVLLTALPAMCQKTDSKQPPEGKAKEESFAQNASHVLKVVQEVRKAIEKELKLDDEEEEVVDDIFDDTVKQVNDEARRRLQEEKRNAAKIKQVKDKMQKAREDRDWEAFREHREEYQELTGGALDVAEVLDGLHEALKEELGDEHHPALEKIISKFRQEREKSMEGLMRVTVLFQAMKDIKLDADQQKEWDRLRTELTKELKDLDKADEESQLQKSDEFRDRIFKILDDDQIAAFERAEEKALAAMPVRHGDAPVKGELKPTGQQKQKANPSKGSDDDESEEEDEDEESGND